MLKDVIYAIRQLLKAPVFSLAAILTIALGMGANTAVFAVVNSVLLNPLPYPRADRIVVLAEQIPDFKEGSISYPNFLDWERMNHSFSMLAAYRQSGYSLSGRGEPEHLHGEMVSAGFFEILGIKPVIGRTFKQSEDQRGADPTAMISEGLWRRKFGSMPNIIGQRLVLDGVGRTVIGIIPASFHLRVENFQSGAMLNDVYTPIGQYNDSTFYSDRGAGWGMRALGLLKPGITPELAQQDMDRVSRDLAAAYPTFDTNEKAYVVSLKESMVGDMRLPLLVLSCAVVFVLLIACVNVSNLLLARSMSREREFAIRIAIGAGQWHVIRQLLTESVLLAVIGGGLGVLLAQSATAAELAAAPHTLPRAEEIGLLDLRVLVVTGLTSLAAGAAFGLAPALKMWRANLDATIRETGRSIAGSRSRTQDALVIAEVALAMVLLVGAGLMVRTLVVLWGLDPGFNPRGVMTFSFAPPPALAKESPAGVRTFLRHLHSELASIPGVEAASLSGASALMDSDYDWYFWFVGRPKPANLTELPMALTYIVESDYPKTFQIPVERGRFFNESDNETSTPVAVIDDTLARKYYPGQSPLGQYLDLGINPSHLSRRPRVRIIGVVRNVNQWGLGISDAVRPLRAQVYLPIYQTPDPDLQQVALALDVYVRGENSVLPDFELLRQRLQLSTRGLVLYGAEPMEEVVLRSIADKRFSMSLLAVFAGCALLLASIGIYGVVSHLVGLRTREIGIRIALGASRRDVLRMVLGDGIRMTLIGIVVGIGLALALTQLMTNMLFGIRPVDLTTYSLVTAILCAVAALACYIPAHRAMNIDPLVVLRDE